MRKILLALGLMLFPIVGHSANSTGTVVLSGPIVSYVQSTSTYKPNAVINIGSGTIRNLNVSTFTINGNRSYTNSVINVKDIGAKGDGLTLDTNAIQSVLTSLSSTGGDIYFPRGTYLTGSLTVGNNISLIGEGSEITILSFSINSGVALELGSDSTRVQIKGLKLAHANTANTVTAIHAVTIREFEFDQYAIEYFNIGVNFESPVNCVFNQGRMTGTSNTTGAGIILGSISGGTSATADDVKDSYISGFSTGTWIQNGATNRIRGIYENCLYPIITYSMTNARTDVYDTHFEGNVSGTPLMTTSGNSKIFASGVVGYDNGYITDWGLVVSGDVTVVTSDEILLSPTAKIRMGSQIAVSSGTLALQNEGANQAGGIWAMNPAHTAYLQVFKLDSTTHTTVHCNGNSFRIQQASTTLAVGGAGSASALPSFPLGYIYEQIGGVDVAIPYYKKQ